MVSGAGVVAFGESGSVCFVAMRILLARELQATGFSARRI